MKVKANIIKSIFLRKGGRGIYTIDGCIIPDTILDELSIDSEQVILSYFKNNKEWCILTEEFIYFKNPKEPRIASVQLSEIYDAKPFNITQIGIAKPPQFNCIFITLKNNTQYSIYLEDGNPFYGFLQVIDYISHQNGSVSD